MTSNPSDSQPQLPAFRVTFSCKQGHTQIITWYGQDESFVRNWAKLVDGTSPLYSFPPREDKYSVLGKCGICRSLLSSDIEDIRSEVEAMALTAGCAAARWNTGGASPRSCDLCEIGSCPYRISRNPLPENK